MPNHIRVLSEKTINQIAAGEVIENTSSVIKELIENALDAEAEHIVVDLEAAGRQKITVSDDGIGMSSDDAILCLERHATSKIKETEDLDSLITMGFRGEALPSIASISKLKIITATEQTAPNGYQVTCIGGKLLPLEPKARNRGTTVEVRSLFYNLPVRKQFQKSTAYEMKVILDLIGKFALAHYNKQWTLILEGKQQAFYPKYNVDYLDALKLRIQSVFGKEQAEDAFKLNFQQNGIIVQGWIGPPHKTKPHRKQQILFVNSRLVDSSAVSLAVREGYGTRIDSKRYPWYVLSIQIDPKEVDCNVHPQKHQVRFKREADLTRLIIKAVHQSLQPKMDEISTQTTFQPINPFMGFRRAVNPSESLFSSQPAILVREEEKMEGEFIGMEMIPHVWGILGRFALIDGVSVKAHIQIPGKSISDSALLLCDIPGSRSRIIYDKMFRAFESHEHIDIQQLLIPETITLTSSEEAVLRPYLEDLNKLGLQIREFGLLTYVIDGIPSLIEKDNLDAFIHELIEELGHVKANLVDKRRKYLLQAVSKASSKPSRKITSEEASLLLKELMRCHNPYFSPFGKPTMNYVNAHDIEKLFSS